MAGVGFVYVWFDVWCTCGLCLVCAWFKLGSCLVYVWIMIGSCLAYVWFMLAVCSINVVFNAVSSFVYFGRRFC